jgi:DNA transposition AAA+ family ATPase
MTAGAAVEIVLPPNSGDRSARGGEVPRIKINSVVNNLEKLAKRAYKMRCIIAHSSRTGLGKTTAVNHLAGTLAIPHRIVRCKQTTSLRALLAAIALNEGEAIPKSHRMQLNANQLYERAVERARREPYLLVIDEADRLPKPCFECVRDLWDDARLPVLLIGNEELEPIINAAHQRLARRIRVRFSQPDLKPEATREVLEFMGFSFTDEEAALLLERCGGSPGWWESVLITRDQVAESRGAKPGIDDLVGAFKYFRTLGK